MQGRIIEEDTRGASRYKFTKEREGIDSDEGKVNYKRKSFNLLVLNWKLRKSTTKPQTGRSRGKANRETNHS